MPMESPVGGPADGEEGGNPGVDREDAGPMVAFMGGGDARKWNPPDVKKVQKRAKTLSSMRSMRTSTALGLSEAGSCASADRRLEELFGGVSEHCLYSLSQLNYGGKTALVTFENRVFSCLPRTDERGRGSGAEEGGEEGAPAHSGYDQGS